MPISEFAHIDFKWVDFITYALVTAITPGPNNIMSMSNAGRFGMRRALPFNVGILGGFVAVITICTLFSSLFAMLIPKIDMYMRAIGLLYILYLAWKTWTSSPELEDSHVKNSFFVGLSLQFINPKLYIYSIISMKMYILPYYDNNIVALASFGLLLAFIGFLCTLLWAGFGHCFKLLFSRHARITNAIMALLLVYCAVSLYV